MSQNIFQQKGTLTRVGKCLNIVTGIVSLAFGVSLPLWILPLFLKPGTHYPVITVGIYTLLFGAGFYFSTSWILKKLGFATVIPQKDNATEMIVSSKDHK